MRSAVRPPRRPPRTFLGWVVTGGLRGGATGALYPPVVLVVMGVVGLYFFLNPPEPPPGTFTSSSDTSFGGAMAGLGYLGLLTSIAATVGTVVGAVVGGLAGVCCAAIDALTRHRLRPNLVGLCGAGLYGVVVLVVSDGDSDPLAILLALGPGLLAVVTLMIVPIRFGTARPWRMSPTTSPPVLRAARPDDGPRLQEIERAAGERFRDIDLAAIADDEPMTIEQLAAYAEQARSWVVSIVDHGVERVVGYVVVDLVDGQVHVEQISIDPGAQGRGLGRALLDRVDEFARGRGCTAVTLTTFTDVPWNAPLYEHLGFRTLDTDQIGPELAALVEAEAAHGLDPDQRVVMRREVVKESDVGADTSTGPRSRRSGP